MERQERRCPILALTCTTALVALSLGIYPPSPIWLSPNFFSLPSFLSTNVCVVHAGPRTIPKNEGYWAQIRGRYASWVNGYLIIERTINPCCCCCCCLTNPQDLTLWLDTILDMDDSAEEPVETREGRFGGLESLEESEDSDVAEFARNAEKEREKANENGFEDQ